MTLLGRWWNDNEIEVVEIGGKAVALYGWNGEEYLHCFEVTNRINGIYHDSVDSKEYSVRPVYTKLDEDEYELTGYEFV